MKHILFPDPILNISETDMQYLHYLLEQFVGGDLGLVVKLDFGAHDEGGVGVLVGRRSWRRRQR